MPVYSDNHSRIYTQVHLFFFYSYFLEKLECFQFLATDQRHKQQYRQDTEDLETENSIMAGSDFYLHRNLAALALSSSLLFHFILFSVNIIWT